MRVRLVSICLVGLLGCASAPAATPDAPASEAALMLEAAQLHGHWAEYWAPGGHLKTQRHLFLPDGRWSWLCEGGCAEPVARSGHWSLHGAELRIASEDGEQRLVLAQCPPNDEARSIDADYRCLTIGTGTFWWQGAADAAAAGSPPAAAP